MARELRQGRNGGWASPARSLAGASECAETSEWPEWMLDVVHYTRGESIAPAVTSALRIPNCLDT